MRIVTVNYLIERGAILKSLVTSLAELIRIVIVLGIVYGLLGVVVFGSLYEKWSYSTTLFVHVAISVLVTFVWYRKRGRFTGWF